MIGTRRPALLRLAAACMFVLIPERSHAQAASVKPISAAEVGLGLGIIGAISGTAHAGMGIGNAGLSAGIGMDNLLTMSRSVEHYFFAKASIQAFFREERESLARIAAMVRNSPQLISDASQPERIEFVKPEKPEFAPPFARRPPAEREETKKRTNPDSSGKPVAVGDAAKWPESSASGLKKMTSALPKVSGLKDSRMLWQTAPQFDTGH